MLTIEVKPTPTFWTWEIFAHAPGDDRYVSVKSCRGSVYRDEKTAHADALRQAAAIKAEARMILAGIPEGEGF